jgi:dienelactone hydrolase
MKTNLELLLEDTSLRRKSIGIEFHGNEFLGHMVAPSEASGPRPLVLVIHNYQGLKGFDVDVAEYLARVGYVGLAIDMYGNDVPADERDFPADTTQIMHFQKQCFEAMVKLDHDHELLRSLLDCWIRAGVAEEWVASDSAPSAIGYCFGGMVVIEGVRGGLNLAGGVFSWFAANRRRSQCQQFRCGTARA